MHPTTDLQPLWAKYARTGCPHTRETLICQYAPLARRAVDRLHIAPWGCVSREDLLSHAVVGLIDAIDRYDPQQGVPFEGYALPRIRGAVLDALRRLDWAPRSLRAGESRLKRAYEHLEGALGRAPTDDEVAAELNLSLSELDRLEAQVARGLVVSLDDLVSRSRAPGEAEPDVPDTADTDPYCRQERAEAMQHLVRAIQALPEREKLVVSLYYFRGLTLKELGQVLSVSEQRVSQLHARAMTRLSHKLIRHTDLLHSLAA